MINRRRTYGELSPKDIIMTSESNPEVLAICYAQGWAKHADYMTAREAAKVKTLRSAVFGNNTNITHFEELQYFGVTTLIDKFFYFCHNLERVVMSDSITTIGAHAFQRVYEMTNISFPKHLTEVGNAGMFHMTGLLEADFSQTELVSLGNQCFDGCESMIKTSLPSTVTSIGDGCFSGCTKITTFIIEAQTPPVLGINVFKSCNYITIYVPDDSIDSYKEATNWSTYASRIKGLSELPE